MKFIIREVSILTLNQLIYFQTVARTEHFRKAAEELNISQPSLSHSISSLEDELGVKFFQRSGRNVTLTKYGKIFLEKVDSILFELHLAEKQMKRLSGNCGNIDIAYVSPLSYRYIPKLIRSFLGYGDNSKITFSFHQCLTKDVLDGLKKDKFDVGFCAFSEDVEGMNFIPIIQQNIILIVSKNHPLSSRDEVELKEIENYPVIGYDKTSALGGFTRRIMREKSLNPEIVYECPDENSIASLVSEEFGIAIVADIDLLENYNIKKIRFSDTNFSHNVYLTYKKDSYQPESLRNFIEFARNYHI